MKAIVAAAGKGTRMSPFGETTPKLLTPLFNKPLLHHFVTIFQNHVDEIIFIIDNSTYGEKIKTYVESNTWPCKISFAIQTEPKGTAQALQTAQKFIPEGERFLFTYGDDYYNKIDIDEIVKHELGIVGYEVQDPEKWGILLHDQKGNLVKVVEKPLEYIGNLANVGIMLLHTDIFDFYNQISLSTRGEYELPDSLSLLAHQRNLKVIKSKGKWLPIGYPWHLLTLHKELINENDFLIEGNVHPNVTVKGRLKLGKGSTIHSGTIIEGDVIIGENSSIGENSMLAGTVIIGDGTSIGSDCNIKDTTLFTNVTIKENTVIHSSVIGNSAKIGTHVVIHSLVDDDKTVEVMIKGKLTDSGFKELGVFIGDKAIIGDNTYIHAGKKIGTGINIPPNSNIVEDRY